MFNPKTFIERFQDNQITDNIILSPPKQFADIFPKINNVCNENIFNDNENVEISLPLKLSNEINDTNKYDDEFIDNFVDEENVFENVTGPSIASVNMSVSHEIETWTLSPEETDINIDHINLNPKKSFTVMRTNPTHLVNVNPNRSEKLSKFKFESKEKFKYKVN